MSRRRRLAIAAGLLPLASGIGCSLVYSYGEVPAALQGTGDGSVQTANDGMAEADHEPGDGGPGLPDSSSEGGPAGLDAEAGTLPPVGAVVISGYGKGLDGGASYVLSVLDPTTGKELSREDIAAVGIAYDAAADVWYIFETLNPGPAFTAGPYPPSPGDSVMLHVRQLDTHTGAWNELKKLAVPTIAVANLITPLTGRLAYVAYPQIDAGSGYELVVLDTSTPANTSADLTDPGVSVTPIALLPTALIGTRSTLTGNVGGNITLVQNTSTGVPGNLQFVVAKINANSVTIGSSAAVVGPAPTTHSIMGAGSYFAPGGSASDLFALPGADGGVNLLQYDPSSGTQIADTDVAFAGTTSDRFGLAVSQCAQTVFVSQVTATTLFAIPLASGGTPKPFDVTHTVSNMLFEPFTNTAIASFNGGDGYEILALTLGGTPTVPTLTSRSPLAAVNPWAPPADLRPTTIAVRQPIPFACPMLPDN
jgi:hypothetical protein